MTIVLAMMCLHAVLFVASAARLVHSRGLREAWAFFALVYCTTFAAEQWAQRYGTYGVHYAYDPARWPGPTEAVQFLVPAMWFAMMVPAQDLAAAIVGSLGLRTAWVKLLATAFVGATWMTTWDLLLDPISVARGLWAWEASPSLLFGIPVENFAAWFTGTLGLHVLLLVLLPAPPRHPGASVAIYASTGIVYLPLLPDPRLCLVSLVMVLAALAAATVEPRRSGYPEARRAGGPSR